MSKFFVFPYAQGSAGAKMLAEELDGKRILREGSSYQKKPGHVVINWGASDCPAVYKADVNPSIKAVLNKKTFFETLKGTGTIPKFATSKIEAAATLQFPIFCRTKLQGKDGEGIVIAEKWEDLVEAKLYTQYVDKTSEYRIHVGRGPAGYQVIGSQKKVKKQIPDGPNVSPDARIWTGDGVGLVWTVHGQAVFVPDPVKAAVKKAFEKFPELTFAAFDVIFDNSSSAAYVLEANTAPMGTPETMKRYAHFFKSLYPGTVEAATPTPAAPSSAANTIGATPIGAPPLPVITVESVMSKLASGQLTFTEVVCGYVTSQQPQG